MNVNKIKAQFGLIKLRHWLFYYIAAFFRFYVPMKNRSNFQIMIGRKKNSVYRNGGIILFPSPFLLKRELYKTNRWCIAIAREILTDDRQKGRNPCALVGSLPSLPPQSTPFPLPIFSVELIRSMRAPGRADTVSICEPTQTGFPRGATAMRTHDFCTRARTLTQMLVHLRDGGHSHAISEVSSSLARSFVHQNRLPFIPSSYRFPPVSFFLAPYLAYRAVFPCAR